MPILAAIASIAGIAGQVAGLFGDSAAKKQQNQARKLQKQQFKLQKQAYEEQRAAAVIEREAAAKAEAYQREGSKIDINSALAAGKLELEAAGVDRKTVDQQLRAIDQQTDSAIFESFLEGERSAYDYEREAKTSIYNARVAGQLARGAKAASRADVRDFRRQGSDAMADRQAAVAASGLTGNSPLLVDRAIMSQIEVGAARIMHGGDVDFFNYLNQQGQFAQEAIDARLNARLVRDTASMNADFAAQAGQIARDAALIGLDVAGFKEKGAQLSIDTATKHMALLNNPPEVKTATKHEEPKKAEAPKKVVQPARGVQSNGWFGLGGQNGSLATRGGGFGGLGLPAVRRK